MAEHRVPMPRAALRSRLRPDPSRSRDPRVRELVAALGRLEPAPAPRAQFRAELRAQLVAVAPRLVVEGEPATAPAREPAPRPRVRLRLVRPLIVTACLFAAFVMLFGAAVFVSQRALPGDALYGLKRASENTRYELTGGAVSKGKLKLEFAARRISEVVDLLPGASGSAAGTGVGVIDPRTAGLVRSTLGSADDDVRSAAQLLGGAAVRGDTAGPLTAITGWTPGPLAAMNQVLARIPAGTLHQRAAATRALLAAAQHRAATLRTELGCNCLTTSGTDQLGPIPCATGCSSGRAGPTPGRSRSGAPGGSTRRGAPHQGSPRPRPTAGRTAPGAGAVPGAGSTGPGGTTAHPGAPLPAPSPPALPTSPGQGGLPGLPGLPSLPALPSLPGLPGLPLPTGSGTPSLPVSIGTCGVSATLGPIAIGVGSC